MHLHGCAATYSPSPIGNAGLAFLPYPVTNPTKFSPLTTNCEAERVKLKPHAPCVIHSSLMLHDPLRPTLVLFEFPLRLYPFHRCHQKP